MAANCISAQLIDKTEAEEEMNKQRKQNFEQLKKEKKKRLLPTMPWAETALERPEDPFCPILVRLPRSRRPSSSRTSCWL